MEGAVKSRNVLDMLTVEYNTVTKAISISDLGSATLPTEKAERFVREMENDTPVLNEGRRIDMQSDSRDIDRVGFQDRILHEKSQSNATKTQDPTFTTNSLNAVELVGISGINDDTMEENIEEDDFEDTLLDLIAGQAGRDFEEVGLNGDTNGSGDPFLNQTFNGWLVDAGNSLDGTSTDFDATDVEDMMQAMYTALPNAFKNRVREGGRFYLSFDAEDDYQNVLRSRGTPLGDSVQTEGTPADYTFKNIPVVPVANLAIGDAQLTHPDNNVWGIRRDIRIEPDRIPKERQTDFVVTMRGDVDYEDEDGVVRAQNYTG